MNETILAAISLLVLAANCTAIVLCFKSSLRQTLLFAAAVAVILAVASPLYQRWTYGPLLARLLPRGLAFLPSLFLLQRGKTPHKLFFTGALLTVTYILPIWAAFGSSLIVGGDADRFMPVTFIIFLPLLGIYFALVLRYGYRLYGRLFAGGHNRMWYLYSAYPVISLYALSNLFDTVPPSFAWLQQPGRGVYFLLTLFILAGFVLLCAAIVTTQKNTSMDYELRLSKNILDYGRGYYELLAERQEDLRVMRHDYKHHLNVLQRLIHKGESEAVIEAHLAELSHQYDEADTPVYAGNAVVDALIGSMDARCAELGIPFEAAVRLPEGMTIPNHALCIVLGNLLENALEACAAIPAGQARFIRLDVKPKGAQLAIRVENSFDGMVRLEEGKMLSRKTDGGMGLRSVRMIAERLGGGHHLQWEDNVFHAYVLLNL